MSSLRSGTDRLLPRYEMTNHLELAWNVTRKHSRFRKEPEEFGIAVVRDLTLEGALVEVPGSDVLPVGSRVPVRLRGQDGQVEIRRCAGSASGAVRYGVRFVPEPAFQSCVNEIVAIARTRAVSGHLTDGDAVPGDHAVTQPVHVDGPERILRTRRGPAPLHAVFLMLLLCALSTAGLTLVGFFGGSQTWCVAAYATVVGITTLALAATLPRSSPSAPNSWLFISAAVLFGQGAPLAGTAGLLSARGAVYVALAAAPLAILGMIRFEGSKARRGAWIAIILETMSIAAAISAALWVWIERVAPDAYGSTSINLAVEIAAPLGYVLLAGLAVAFALSCEKRHRAALLCLAAWACIGAATSQLAATAATDGNPTSSIAQFVSMTALLLPLSAAALSPIRGHIGIGSDTARAERGFIAVLPIAFAGLALLGYRLGLFGETVAWLALLGLPGAVARIMIMAREHRDAADRLAAELAQSRLRQEELVHAKNDAESARRAQQLFLSRTSHELRTPIHILNGFSELLALTPLDSKQGEMISRVRSAGEHLSELVADVLDLSQIDQGRLSVRPEPVAVDRFVIDLLAHLGPDAESRSAVLLFGGTGQRTNAMADPARLRQVLTNLLTNAVKYAGGTIVVSTERAGSMIAIHVVDAGPGIRSSDLERMFVPFERLNAELGEEPGTGLGLSVSRSLCDAMGGTLTVESSVGIGSRFTVTLPVHAADSLTPAPVGDDRAEEPGREAFSIRTLDPARLSA